jgi:hypothetical protein
VFPQIGACRCYAGRFIRAEPFGHRVHLRQLDLRFLLQFGACFVAFFLKLSGAFYPGSHSIYPCIKSALCSVEFFVLAQHRPMMHGGGLLEFVAFAFNHAQIVLGLVALASSPLD